MADKLLVNPIDCEGHGACARERLSRVSAPAWLPVSHVPW